MSYYRTCPHCGGALDPGERCSDCEKEKTAASAANTDNGVVDLIGTRSASIIEHKTGGLQEMKFPIDAEKLLHIVKANGGDANTLEVAAVASLMNRAYAQGVEDGKKEAQK